MTATQPTPPTETAAPARAGRRSLAAAHPLPLPVTERRGTRRVVRRLGPPVPLTSVQGALALDLDVPAPAPALPAPRSRLLAGRSGLTPVAGQEPDPLHTWSTQFAQALVEATVGTRPVVQLLRATSPEVYADLHHRATLLTGGGTRARSVRHVRPQVRSVHVSRLHVYAAELSVVVQQGQRCRAIAIRAERREGRWQAVDVQFG